MGLCESEKGYRLLELSGQLRKAVGAYSVGARTTDVVETLAYARVLSYRFGGSVPHPLQYDRSTWNGILDGLVLRLLGDRRCLSCGDFFRSSETIQCASVCPHCQQINSEAVECLERTV